MDTNGHLLRIYRDGAFKDGRGMLLQTGIFSSRGDEIATFVPWCTQWTDRLDYSRPLPKRRRGNGEMGWTVLF